MTESNDIELKKLRNDIAEKKQRIEKADQMKEFGFIFIGGPFVCLTLLFSDYFIIGIIVCFVFSILTFWYCYTIFVKINPSKLRRNCKKLEYRIIEINTNVAHKKDKEIRDKKRLSLIKEIKIRINYTDEFLNAMNFWGIDKSEDKKAKEERLLIEARLKDKLNKFNLVRAFKIQKLVGDRYALKLHAGGPGAHERWREDPPYYGLLCYEWLLITEDSNLNSTELALAEYPGMPNIINKYTTLRIIKNRPLMLKEQFNSFEQGHDLW